MVSNIDQKAATQLIENAHRTGKKGSKPRHIIVRVHSRLIKRQIMITAKDKLKCLSCHLIEDLTHSDYLLKGKAKKQMEEAFRLGKIPRFTSGKLFIDWREVEINN